MTDVSKYRYVVLPVSDHVNQFRMETSMLGMGDNDVRELVTQIFDELMSSGVRPVPNMDMLMWRVEHQVKPSDPRWNRVVQAYATLRMGIHQNLNELRILPGLENGEFSYCFDQFRLGSDVVIRLLSTAEEG